jgi:hypothetical protein
MVKGASPIIAEILQLSGVPVNQVLRPLGDDIGERFPLIPPAGDIDHDIVDQVALSHRI